MKRLNLILMVISTLIVFNITFAQSEEQEKEIPIIKPIELEGPRFGFTIVSNKLIDYVAEKNEFDLKPFMAQFGWQFEKRFFTVSSGATAVTEWVFLVGGFEQNKFLPSLTWLIGMRNKYGFELGAGPNLNLSGTSIVYALGITIPVNEINFPVNFAINNSQNGNLYSVLVGFNVRAR